MGFTIMKNKITRRKFNKSFLSVGTAIGLTSIKPSMKILGANDRIRLGFIGTANRGCQLINAFLPHSDCEVAAICDVHNQSLDKAAEIVGRNVPKYKDFRKMLEQQDIDAIVIGTPDHWHAIQFVTSAKAGKDIYVEKPLSLTVFEGRKMVEAARYNNIVSQVGSQRRSGPHYIEAVKLVRSGKIGKPTSARFYRISNMFPNGIGSPPDSPPPPELDWDMWLGPAPKIPYNENKCLYKFRWFSNYSSQVANWGAHHLDIALWLLNEKGPVRVAALGGNYAVKDNRDIPDTLQIIYEFPGGAIASFGLYEASSGRGLPERFGFELRGTDGTLYTRSDTSKIIPADHGQFQDREIPIEEMEIKGDTKTENHTRNFLDCIKSRERCNADIEDGHRAAVCCHLGNIAYKTKSLIEWDPETEKITNNKSFNKYLHYQYRLPWKLG